MIRRPRPPRHADAGRHGRDRIPAGCGQYAARQRRFRGRVWATRLERMVRRASIESATGRSSRSCAPKLGVADYLGSLQAFRDGVDDDPRLLQMSRIHARVSVRRSCSIPGALAAIAHLRGFGRPVGAVGRRHGVSAAQDPARRHLGRGATGAVLIYLHKEQVLDHVQQRYPAPHYVMVDDKPNLLAAMKLAARAQN